SPRFLAASTINSKRSRTFTCPVNSLNIGGRSEISKAASGSGGFMGADAFITPGRDLRTMRFDWFWGAHAPPRARFGAVAEMPPSWLRQWIVDPKKFAIARARSPAREARALPGRWFASRC